MKKGNQRRRLTASQFILLGFLGGILAGSLLLMLPFATREAGHASFADAFFTATSAICVTGLVVQDTASYWSYFGQAVILTLIQIGGMGVITAAVAIAMVSGKKIGLMQRSTLQEAISATQVGGIVRLAGFIVRTMFLLEGLGMFCLAPTFCRLFGPGKGLWYALFHAVSAFCNAGFDLMGTAQPYSSLTSFSGNPTVNGTIMVLIVVGGIGFLTWDDIKSHWFHIRKYRMQSKVILSVTFLLILFPAFYFYFYEFSGPRWAYMSRNERFWASLFQSVTPRTAGFNTVDLTKVSESGQLILILLMLVGGSPGSTAGGMKTTTLAVLVMTAFAVFQRRESPQCFDRRIPEEAIRNAAAVLFLYFVLFLFGGILISCVEDVPIITALFETASAIGTVGLTLGITSSLGMFSRLILVLLMYVGRVGGLTLVYGVMAGRHVVKSRLPQGKIMIG